MGETATSDLAATRTAIDFDAGEAVAIPLTDAAEEMVVSEAEAPAGEIEGDSASELGRGELIEPGRALALADFSPPSVGAGEWLVRFAYRMGVPGSVLGSAMGKS